MKVLLFFLLFFATQSHGQEARLPLLAYKGSPACKTLVFYLSGDGGLQNLFSKTFIKRFRQQGYSILCMSSKSYFRSRKTPEQAASAIGTVICTYLNNWACQDFVFIGYSFGADVAPFLLQRFSYGLTMHAKHLILLSPSRKIDFEVHHFSSLGFYKNKGENVPDEINRLILPTTLIFGSNENEFPYKDISARNVKTVIIPGGHHYHWNVNEVVKQIINAAQ